MLCQAHASAHKDDVWNNKNVKGTHSVKISKGSPYEDVVYEGKWQPVSADSTDLSDLIPQKRVVWAIRLISATTTEARLIEYGEFQNYDIYEYNAIFDLNNGHRENLSLEYGSRRFLGPVKQATGQGQRFDVESRTCWFGTVGC